MLAPTSANEPASSSTPKGNGPVPDSQTLANEEETMGNVMMDAVSIPQSKMAACGQKLDTKYTKIAVVGTQGSGKSSVLQSVVGKDFLPIGKGLATRRPTIIQCIPIPEGEVPKLTVVDLPGMVKIIVDDQDECVIPTVREMVLENIRDERTIILAVCPANQPIATSDALQIAKEVDPNRERTIGVVTKLDLMDAATNAVDVLENRELPLKKGYVGVVNRSQLDIEKKRDRAYGLEKEKQFFKESRYSHMAHRMGSPYLQECLRYTVHAQSRLTSRLQQL